MPDNEFIYGWPSGTPEESNVAVQFLFEDYENDNNGGIFDQVADIILAKVGSPVYRVDTTAYSPRMQWGIKIPNPGTSAYFYKTGADSNFDIGTSDATFEFIIENFEDNFDHYMTFIETMNSSNNSGYRINLYGDQSALDITLYATDATNLTIKWESEYIFKEGPHKLRIALDRDDIAKCYVDGVQCTAVTSASLSALSGKSIVANNVYYGARQAGNWVCPLIWNEFRFSRALNNSGGPNGG